MELHDDLWYAILSFVTWEELPCDDYEMMRRKDGLLFLHVKDVNARDEDAFKIADRCLRNIASVSTFFKSAFASSRTNKQIMLAMFRPDMERYFSLSFIGGTPNSFQFAKRFAKGETAYLTTDFVFNDYFHVSDVRFKPRRRLWKNRRVLRIRHRYSDLKKVDFTENVAEFSFSASEVGEGACNYWSMPSYLAYSETNTIFY